MLITSILCGGLFIFHELENTTDTQLIIMHNKACQGFSCVMCIY